jgi:hypothetical protein
LQSSLEGEQRGPFKSTGAARVVAKVFVRERRTEQGMGIAGGGRGGGGCGCGDGGCSESFIPPEEGSKLTTDLRHQGSASLFHGPRVIISSSVGVRLR